MAKCKFNSTIGALTHWTQLGKQLSSDELFIGSSLLVMTCCLRSKLTVFEWRCPSPVPDISSHSMVVEKDFFFGFGQLAPYQPSRSVLIHGASPTTVSVCNEWPPLLGWPGTNRAPTLITCNKTLLLFLFVSVCLLYICLVFLSVLLWLCRDMSDTRRLMRSSCWCLTLFDRSKQVLDMIFFSIAPDWRDR